MQGVFVLLNEKTYASLKLVKNKGGKWSNRLSHMFWSLFLNFSTNSTFELLLLPLHVYDYM